MKKKITPSKMFKRADANKDNVINYLEMKKYLQNEFTEDEMSFEVKIHFLKELATLFEQDNFTEDEFLLVM